MNIAQLKNDFETTLRAVKTPEDLERVERAYLGRGDGKLTVMLRGLKDLSEQERKVIGPKLQGLKREWEEQIRARGQGLAKDFGSPSTRFAEASARRASSGNNLEGGVDLTLPPAASSVGHQHPLTKFMDRCIDVFTSMGFEVVLGPEVETAEYNFTKLNMGEDHPARDLWDTFYLAAATAEKSAIPALPAGRRNPQSENRLLLRTHTSPVQLRAMEKRKPPVRIIVPGRVFRHEATDAGHETTFYQLEGFAIDKGVRVTDLIGTLQSFLEAIFGKVETRVRPHYYPFVEPGMDIDMRCLICSGAGCSVCKHSGWLEMLGSGMIHPNVLKNMHVDSKIYSGFAFGLGIDRFMMLYHRINDVRLSYSGDLRFVRQF